jgi:hypothetical protein
MNEKEQLLHLIKMYEEYVKKGNQLLKETYHTERPPLLAKREGTIPPAGTIETGDLKMSFRFHGMGCRFDFAGIIIEFDYTFGGFVYKGFQSSKLYWFIESYPDASPELKSKERFSETLSELLQNETLLRKNDSSPDSYEYILIQ